MKVSNNLNTFLLNFKQNASNDKSEQHIDKSSSNSKSLLDNFETSIVNSADLNDTIQVPRTIFKGYLSFTIGTALIPIAMIAKNKHPKTSNLLNILAACFTVWGTYSFVRPYIIKNQKENESKEVS